MVAQTLGLPVRHVSAVSGPGPSALEQATAGLVLVTAEVDPRPPDAVLLTRSTGSWDGAAEVIQLGRRDRLTEVLATVAHLRAGPVVAVHAACGGLGATTLAAAMAVSAAPSTLVELDPLGLGFDAMFGTETTPGLRWADFAGLDSPLAGRPIVDELVPAGSLRLLGAGCNGIQDEPDWLARRHALRAVAAQSARTVVDLGRAADPRLWPEPDAVVVLVPDDPVGVLAGARCAGRLAGAVRRLAAVLVHRSHRPARQVPRDEVSAVLDEWNVPVIGRLGSVRALRASAEAGARGDWPSGLRHGPVAGLAGICWQWFGEPGPAGGS